MNLKDAIREAYFEAIKNYYDDKADKYIGGEISDVDERIDLEGLMNRIDCEINLATEELEYNVFDDDLPEDEEDIDE